MPTSVTLRIQQQGYVRSNGYQATQWAVTVPIVDPAGAPPRATDPSSFAPMFVIDTAGPREVLRRVATLRDYQELTRAELRYFDVRTLGAAGRAWFDNVNLGDTLRLIGQPPHWVQDQAPYTDWDFIVEDVSYRVNGGVPSVAVGKSLTLAGYTFRDEDVGRWVELRGFASPSYNGLVQIVSIQGNVAIVDKTYTTNETGTTWGFPWIGVAAAPVAGLEPRYFPVRASDLAWALVRGGSTICSASNGGDTRRAVPQGQTLVRSVRFTELAPSLSAGVDLFTSTRAELARLHDEATSNAIEFSPLAIVTEDS